MSFNKNDFKSVLVFDNQEFIIPNNVIIYDKSEREFSLINEDGTNNPHATIKKQKPTRHKGEYALEGTIVNNYIFSDDWLKNINAIYLLDRTRTFSNYSQLFGKYVWVRDGMLKSGRVFEVVSRALSTIQQGLEDGYNEDWLDKKLKVMRVNIILPYSYKDILSNDLKKLKEVCRDYKELFDMILDF